MGIACRWLLATQRRCVRRLHRARSSRHSRHARPPWYHGGRWQARFSAALHCKASPWRRELRTIGRCPSQWFGFAPRHADACDPQQHKPSRARGCVREYSECFSPQQSTRGGRYLLPPVFVSTWPLQRRRRCNSRSVRTWPFDGGGDLEKRDSRRQRVEVLDHKRHHPIVAAIPPATPTECDAKLKAKERKLGSAEEKARR